MDTLVVFLPGKARKYVDLIVNCINFTFGAVLLAGCSLMADSVYPMTIPTLGISTAFRYLPPIIAGALIMLFSVEHLIALFADKKVIRSWH